MRRHALPVVLGLVGLLSAARAAEPAAPPLPPAKPPLPTLHLPDRAASGQRAIDLLGDRLPEVAAHYRSSPQAFREQLLRDKHLHVDSQGRVFMIEPLHAPASRTPPPDPGRGLLDGTLAPLADSFKLHSRQGARRTVYLNFVGGTLGSSIWAWDGMAVPPLDIDSQPGSFSAAELALVQGVWQRVAEDYAPFEVDVTTEAPAPRRLTRTNSGDGEFGITVFVTGGLSGRLCGGCGGVAYLGVFDDVGDHYKPVFVFHDALWNDEKNIAEAASHEAGHTLGLYHDGTTWSPYYAGQGSGPTAWAPIMGLGFDKPVVQWSRSDYANANNFQDEVAVMQTFGLPLRADDHGNGPASATTLQAATVAGQPVQTGQGVIERPDDVDVFSFSAAAGSVSVLASPAARAPNLDILLTLRNRDGLLIASSNPEDALGAGLSAVLPAAGTYYLSVQGTGRGDPLVDGYSAYGSRGRYAVSVRQP